MKWKTQTGKLIDIKEMDDNHLKNSINYLKRKLDEKPLEQVYVGDSDFAEQSVESENRINEDISEYFKKSINVLEKEQKRRLKLICTNDNCVIPKEQKQQWCA